MGRSYTGGFIRAARLAAQAAARACAGSAGGAPKRVAGQEGRVHRSLSLHVGGEQGVAQPGPALDRGSQVVEQGLQAWLP